MQDVQQSLQSMETYSPPAEPGPSRALQSPEAREQPIAQPSSGERPSSTSLVRGSTLPVGAGGLRIPTRVRLDVAGTKGRPTVLRTNHFALNLTKLSKQAFKYDVDITPDKPKRLMRFAMEEFRKTYYADRYPAFDGRKIMFSAQPLPFKGEKFEGTVNVMDEESQRPKEFKVCIKLTSRVELTPLFNYMGSGTSLDAPQSALQALDVVLRCGPALQSVVVGRSFFNAYFGQAVPLGGGYDLRCGGFQGINLGWKPYLNVDVVHKAFPVCQPVTNLISEICGDRRSGAVDLTRPMSRDHVQQLEEYIKGLKVDYEIRGIPTSKRTWKVNGVVGCASDLKFEHEGRQITVRQYFEETKRIRLQYGHLPCLHVGSPSRNIYVPIEFCTVRGGQAVRVKLNEMQTTNMIRSAATPPDVRMGKIREEVRKAGVNTNKYVQEFGLQMNESPEEVKARVLEPPQLAYGNRQSVQPRSGAWFPNTFLEAGSLQKWAVLIVDRFARQEDITDFLRQFTNYGQQLGMNISNPMRTDQMDSRRLRTDLQPFLRRCADNECQLVLVIVPERGLEYSMVKQAAVLNVGIVTQCVRGSTLQRKRNESTIKNILQKVNGKLNGINHIMHTGSKPRVFEDLVMVVGADVTHPSPGEFGIPSLAAVCASHDRNAFKYNIQLRVQPPREEIILDLKNIMLQQLRFFNNKNGNWPQRIFFYRDGVSEGQFMKVLQHELIAIRQACSGVQKDYQPLITFLVVQKRHHTRFFPIHRQDMDGKNCNVKPGTIVDTTITHPTEREFYLVSHFGIQGVSRPTKYHLLWDDNDLSEDVLQEMTYYLCHLFSRCARSVSYPAPTYNAHLAAFAARVLLKGRTLDRNSTEELQVMLNTESSRRLQAQFPMFFI